MRKLEIVGAVDQSYGEIPQTNPLRWTMLYRTGESTFERQTKEIKCKDFFNDTLAYFKEGQVFNMYGYTSQKKKNDEGVYFLLTHIGDQKSFGDNLQVLNQKLREQLDCELTYEEFTNDSGVLLIPNPCWESTWKLSLVTMLIRCCNYGYKYEKWDDFYRTDAPMNSVERTFDIRAKANTQAWGFIVPTKYQQYWYFVGPDYNSVKLPKQTGGTIHNNGCVGWSTYMDCVLTQHTNKALAA